LQISGKNLEDFINDCKECPLC